MNQIQFRNAVLVTSEIVACAATVVILVKLIGGKDASRTLRMAAAKKIETVCMSGAIKLADISSLASNVYDQNRLVTL